MARYIDADKLKKESKMLYSVHSFEPVEGYTQDQIDNAPTADLQAENAALKARLDKAVEFADWVNSQFGYCMPNEFASRYEELKGGAK